ncbi:MAG: 50S ribosomal protein L9, partial [Patescibacteria group bacterium]
KNVSVGYARNFLLARGLAASASPNAMAGVRREAENKVKAAVNELKHAEQIASRLDGEEIVIASKANAEGRLYAAVTSQKIADAVETKFAIEIPPERVIIRDHIKALGDYTVRIECGHGLEADVALHVSSAP